ncbi:MAG: hypothetical protein IPH10_08845 [bacterium]|nr:hypothetical protein [bacterium]
MAELSAIDGAGRSHTHAGSVQGLAGREDSSERSVTLGLSERIGAGMKLAQGVVYVLDGTLQAVVAWEWALGGH